MPLPEDAARALARCSYLLHLISRGDHKAPENAADAALEAVRALNNHDAMPDWWDDPPTGKEG